MATKQKRFVLIGGKPFRSYTGTGTYTGLSVVGFANTEKQMAALTKNKYEECGGLMIWIDLTTGKEQV